MIPRMLSRGLVIAGVLFVASSAFARERLINPRSALVARIDAIGAAHIPGLTPGFFVAAYTGDRLVVAKGFGWAAPRRCCTISLP